jgi:hypothetical protein
MVLAAAWLLASPSGAQTAPTEAPSSETSLPLADTLYQRARELMAAGRYAEACEDFAESNRLDQATGGTLLNLAVCHERLGRVATACAEFEQARALARYYKRPDREELASQHVALLRPRVSTLSITVRDGADGEKVLLDGVLLAKIAWTNLPIDPGDHAVSASAPGKVPWSTTVRIAADRESRTLEVPPLADTPSPVTAPPLALSPVPSPAPPAAESHGSTPRIVGFAIGAVGLAAIGVGAAFGVSAIEENSSSEQACPGNRCTKAGAADSQYALTNANVANVCIISGIVAVGVGTVLVLTSRSKSSTTNAARVLTTLASGTRAGSTSIGGAW